MLIPPSSFCLQQNFANLIREIFIFYPRWLYATDIVSSFYICQAPLNKATRQFKKERKYVRIVKKIH